MDILQNKSIQATKSLKSSFLQGLFLKRLGTLLIEGFSLKEALQFMNTISERETLIWIESIKSGLKQGHSLHEELKQLNFSDRVCSQIYFSIIHGNFSYAVYQSGSQLLKQVDRRKNLNQILNYPLMLIVFMVGMLLSMRYILLPHITQITSSDTSNVDFMTQMILMMIDTAPYWLVGIVFVILVGILVSRSYLNKKTALEKTMVYSKIPIFSVVYKLYQTQFFTFEWSQLIKGGSNLREIVTIMKENQTSKLIRELGYYLEGELISGRSFQEILRDFNFLKKELAAIVKHGEVSGKMGEELELYSNQCEEELYAKVEKSMEWIQPIVFSGIAVMIIAIYAALLLPTFSLLEGI